MKLSKTLTVGLSLLVLMVTGVRCSKRPDTRGVEPVSLAGTVARPSFVRAESTGLFVGVRVFPHDRTLDVPYAVDDAVDLAHRFALDSRVALVPPRRVVLALSGSPQKEESKERLRQLKDAGARVENATSGDILNLMKTQAALAGSRGLFVLSIATHGFQRNGDAFILGATSAFGSPDTSLRIAAILDTAARAKRSLIFIDACRDRIGQGSRGATPDPDAAAPHIRRMARVQGQVIFYAAAPGQYAFDDHVHRNGVFTKAVLDGLNCAASAPNGTVVASTLHTFVDREVRRWIRENRSVSIDPPATQLSMEGETRNMPLSVCWRTPTSWIRAAFDGSTVTAYGDDSRPLWRKDFGEPVVHAEAADLDADAFLEIVVGLRDRIEVFEHDGQPRWTGKGDSRRLQTFTTGDLFEKRTKQIVAVWTDAHSSRLSVLESSGKELSHFEYAGLLQHVAVGRPTNLHAPKIVAASDSSLLLLHAKKMNARWRRALHSASDTIRELRILDVDHDSRDDIAVSTRRGTTWFTFDGKIAVQDEKVVWQDAAIR